MADAAAKLKVARDALHVEDVNRQGNSKAQIRELIPMPGRRFEPQAAGDMGPVPAGGKPSRYRPGSDNRDNELQSHFAGFSADTGDEEIIVHRWDDISVELNARSIRQLSRHDRLSPDSRSNDLRSPGQ